MDVTPAESRIMEVLWDSAPRTVDEIVASVAEPQRWGAATVRTLIHRLLKRGAVRSDRIDGRIRYAPVLSRAEYVQSQSQGLLDRLFNGRLSPLVAHFAERGSLSAVEMEKLQALVAKIDADAG